MKLCDVKIRKSFRKHSPSSEKMDICRRYFNEYGVLDRDIVIDERGTLVDGYVGYLVLKENGVEDWGVKSLSENIDNALLLIAGKHPNNEKVYYWVANRRTKGLYENAKDSAVTYKRACVETKYGPRMVDVVSCAIIEYSDLACNRKHVYKLYR